MSKSPFDLLKPKEKRSRHQSPRSPAPPAHDSEADDESEELPDRLASQLSLSEGSNSGDDFSLDSFGDTADRDGGWGDVFDDGDDRSDDSENQSESAYFGRELEANDIVCHIQGGYEDKLEIYRITDCAECEDAINAVLNGECSASEIAAIHEIWSHEERVITDTDLVLNQFQYFVPENSDAVPDEEVVQQLIDMAKTTEYDEAHNDLPEDLFQLVINFDNLKFFQLATEGLLETEHVERILDDTIRLEDAIWTENDDGDLKYILREITFKRDDTDLLDCWLETNVQSDDDASSDSQDPSEHRLAIQRLLSEAIKYKARDCITHLREEKGARVDATIEESAVLADNIQILIDLDINHRKGLVLIAIRRVKTQSLQHFADLRPKTTYNHVTAALPIAAKKIKQGKTAIFVALWNGMNGRASTKDLVTFLKAMLETAPRAFCCRWIAQVGAGHLTAFIRKRNEEQRQALETAFNQFLHLYVTQKHLQSMAQKPEDSQALSETLCPFPARAELDAAPALMKLRAAMALDCRLSIEDHWVACLSGVPLSSMRRLFPSVMRPAHYVMPVERMETYARAGDSATATELPDTIRVKLKPGAVAAKAKKPKQTWFANTGQYTTPMEALAAMARKTPGVFNPQKGHRNFSPPAAIPSDGNGSIYAASLIYRQRICQHIVDNYKPEKGIVTPIYANGYPNLMVHIKPPEAAAGKSDATSHAWAQNLINLLGPILNILFMNEGHHIESVARASFGFLTTTHAPCDNSIRINIGLIPLACADLIVSALEILDQMLFELYHNIDHSQWPVADTSVFKGDEYGEYLDREVPELATVYDALWTKVEKGKTGQTLAQSMMRTAQLRLWITAEVTRSLQETPPGSATDLAKIWMGILSKVTNEQFKLKSSLTAKKPAIKAVKAPAIPKKHLHDAGLFGLINQIVRSVRINLPPLHNIPASLSKSMRSTLDALNQCQKDGTTRDLYFHFDMLNELLFAWSVYYANSLYLTDGEASDSDDEVVLASHKDPTLYGKKFVPQNGIRSIWLAISIAANWLTRKKGIKKPVFSFINPYFELKNTIEAWTKHSHITFAEQPSAATQILFVDINACETEGRKLPPVTPGNIGKPRILILDITSALPDIVREWIMTVLKSKASLHAVILVASGLKERQLGADKNHHGIVRVFSLDQTTRDELMADLKKIGTPILNRVSHAHRKLMKILGFAATSSCFFPARYRVGTKPTPATRKSVATRPAYRSFNTDGGGGGGGGRAKPRKGKKGREKKPRIRASIYFDPSIKVARGKGGKRYIFRVADPRGRGSNGNCGFTVLGVTRQQLADKLLEHSGDAAVRQSIVEAIKAHYMVHQGAAATFPALYDALLQHQAEETDATTLALNTACANEAVYLLYVENFRVPGVWLDYHSALAYARLSNIELYVWEQPNQQTNQIRVRACHKCGNANGAIHMFYTNSATHFQLLYRTPEDLAFKAAPSVRR